MGLLFVFLCLIAATGTTVYTNAVIPNVNGKKQTNGEINVANLPVYNRGGNYFEGQMVKTKELNGKKVLINIIGK